MIYYINENKEYNDISYEDILFEMMNIQLDISSCGYINEGTIRDFSIKMIEKFRLFMDKIISKIKNFIINKKIDNLISRVEKLDQSVFNNDNIQHEVYHVDYLEFSEYGKILMDDSYEIQQDIIYDGKSLSDAKKELDKIIDSKIKKDATINELSYKVLINYLKTLKEIIGDLDKYKNKILSEYKDASKSTKDNVLKNMSDSTMFNVYMVNKLTKIYMNICSKIIGYVNGFLRTHKDGKPDEMKEEE